MIAQIREKIAESIEAKQKMLQDPKILETLHKVVQACLTTYESKGKVLLAGNGGSAADAQHIAAEFVCRYNFERPALPAIAFNVNTSVITAAANDYGYEDVFKRQVEALALPGDLFIGISTSGNSPNILEAVSVCRERGLVTVGLTGRNGHKLQAVCHHCIMVPSASTPRIQESHIMIGHIICGLVEQALFRNSG